MKNVVVIVKPHIVSRLLDVIRTLPIIDGYSIKAVKGYGRQKNYLNEYHGSEYSMAYVPKIFLEVAVEEEDLELVTSRIIETARTGRMGDGKIFVFDCECC